MSKYLNNKNIVEASYSEQSLSMYKGNPLIEALPNIAEPKEVYRKLIDVAGTSTEECNLSATERKQGVNNLFYCFHPLAVHIDLEQKISSAIRSGYRERNPINAGFTRRLNQFSDSIQNGNMGNIPQISSNIPGFSIFGLSGMGKTTSIKRILKLYPQKIIHHEYNDEPFPFTQIVWMHLVCPYDGGVKGLCQAFFQEFDMITGDNTYEKYSSGKNTIDRMIPQMATIAQRHGLGMLVIDEIQNINVAKSGGTQKILNFINQIVNTIGVPVILMGLPEAEDVLAQNLMIARRSNGEQGTVHFLNYTKDAEEWDDFIENIWKIQWTNVKTPLTTESSNFILDESGGITAMALLLYSIAQKKAILNGELGDEESITLEIIKEAVASDEFKKPREQIKRLKMAKERRMNNLDAITFNWNDIKQSNQIIQDFIPKKREEERNQELQESIEIPKNVEKKIINNKQVLTIVSSEEEF